MTDLVKRLRTPLRGAEFVIDTPIQRAEAADEIERLTARVAELEENTIPKLPNCGKYRATDNTGQWYYINHANTWQGMPDLVKEARAKALREAARVASEACLVPPDGGSPTEEEARMCDEASRQILALLDKEQVS